MTRKNEFSEKQKAMLLAIFKDNSYSGFLSGIAGDHKSEDIIIPNE